jgi:hypothetical protein
MRQEVPSVREGVGSGGLGCWCFARVARVGSVWWGRVGVGCRSDVLWMLAWRGVSSGSGVRLLMPRFVVSHRGLLLGL